MTRANAALALGTLGLVIALAGGSLAWATRDVVLPAGWDTPVPASLVGWLAFIGVGVLLTVRRPGNRIGWLLLVIGLVWQLGDLTGAYRTYVVAEGAAGGRWAAWAWDLLWIPGVALVPFLVLVFPEGRLPSPRWRLAVALLIAGSCMLAAGILLAPGPLSSTSMYDNPTGVAGAAGLAAGLTAVGNLTLAAGFVIALVAPIVRYRQGAPVARQQLKWFAYSVVVVAAAWVVAEVLEARGAGPGLLAGVRTAPLVLLPLATATAVMRYRLYEIDRIVSRTVSYALLSGLLAGVYVSGVLLLSRVLVPLGASSELAVAGATLAAAALFSPARRRVQDAVDRRFNRARYDAEREKNAFRTRLRDEVVLAAIRTALLTSTARTVAPTTSSVWLVSSGEPP